MKLFPASNVGSVVVKVAVVALLRGVAVKTASVLPEYIFTSSPDTHFNAVPSSTVLALWISEQLSIVAVKVATTCPSFLHEVKLTMATKATSVAKDCKFLFIFQLF